MIGKLEQAGALSEQLEIILMELGMTALQGRQGKQTDAIDYESEYIGDTEEATVKMKETIR